jgi:hypothetical protein
MSEPLTLVADPRVVRDGITPAILQEQLAFNLKVRDLASDANHAAEDLRALRIRGAADSSAAASAAITALERELLTPAVRYSRPGLQAHIAYLYDMNLAADQRVGRDARERYTELRAALDSVRGRIQQLAGGPTR